MRPDPDVREEQQYLSQLSPADQKRFGRYLFWRAKWMIVPAILCAAGYLIAALLWMMQQGWTRWVIAVVAVAAAIATQKLLFRYWQHLRKLLVRQEIRTLAFRRTCGKTTPDTR